MNPQAKGVLANNLLVKISAKDAGERTCLRVQFSGVPPESLFGETPNITRGGAYAPQKY